MSMEPTPNPELKPEQGARLSARATPVSYAILVCALLIVADQLIKFWVRHSLPLHASTNKPFPGIFELTLTYNKGIAFGMFQGSGILFAPIALTITYISFRYCQRNPYDWRLTHFSLGMLAAGAIGNLIDRVAFGQVTDMFWIRFFEFPVFNFADACITVGAILLGIRFIFEPEQVSIASDQPINNA